MSPALIACRKRGEQRPGRPLQVPESCRRHAAAHVEDQHDIERKLVEVGERDRLADAVVEQLEIVDGEPADELSPIAHEHVDANALRARLERLRRNEPDVDGGESGDQQRDGHASHHLAPFGAPAGMKGFRSSANRSSRLRTNHKW